MAPDRNAATPASRIPPRRCSSTTTRRGHLARARPLSAGDARGHRQPRLDELVGDGARRCAGDIGERARSAGRRRRTRRSWSVRRPRSARRGRRCRRSSTRPRAMPDVQLAIKPHPAETPDVYARRSPGGAARHGRCRRRRRCRRCWRQRAPSSPSTRPSRSTPRCSGSRRWSSACRTTCRRSSTPGLMAGAGSLRTIPAASRSESCMMRSSASSSNASASARRSEQSTAMPARRRRAIRRGDPGRMRGREPDDEAD